MLSLKLKALCGDGKKYIMLRMMLIRFLMLWDYKSYLYAFLYLQVVSSVGTRTRWLILKCKTIFLH